MRVDAPSHIHILKGLDKSHRIYFFAFRLTFDKYDSNVPTHTKISRIKIPKTLQDECTMFKCSNLIDWLYLYISYVNNNVLCGLKTL